MASLVACDRGFGSIRIKAVVEKPMSKTEVAWAGTLPFKLAI